MSGPVGPKSSCDRLIPAGLAGRVGAQVLLVAWKTHYFGSFQTVTLLVRIPLPACVHVRVCTPACVHVRVYACPRVCMPACAPLHVTARVCRCM